MTKNQKIWLWIFLGMFIIPELIWSPVLGLLPFNKQFTSNDDNHLILTIITAIEFLGLLLAGIWILKFSKFRLKNIIGIILLCLAIWALYVFYLLYATIYFWR